MNNELDDAENESVDKIEVLEAIDDAKNEESDALDTPRHTKKDLLELKGKMLELEEGFCK